MSNGIFDKSNVKKSNTGKYFMQGFKQGLADAKKKQEEKKNTTKKSTTDATKSNASR